MFGKSGKFLFALLSATALLGAVEIRAPAAAGVPGSTSRINLDARGIAFQGGTIRSHILMAASLSRAMQRYLHLTVGRVIYSRRRRTVRPF